MYKRQHQYGRTYLQPPNNNPRPDHSERTTINTAHNHMYGTYLLTVNSNSRPDHSVECNCLYRRASAHNLYPDAEQHITSRPPGFVHWPLPWNAQYRTYPPTPNTKPRADHTVSHNGHYHRKINTEHQYQACLPTTNSKPRPDNPVLQTGHY